MMLPNIKQRKETTPILFKFKSLVMSFFLNFMLIYKRELFPEKPDEDKTVWIN